MYFHVKFKCLLFLFSFGWAGSLLLPTGFSLVMKIRDSSFFWCMGLLIEVALLVAKNQVWAQRLQSFLVVGSIAVAQEPSYLEACGILPDQGLNRCPPHWQADRAQPLGHQGSPSKWEAFKIRSQDDIILQSFPACSLADTIYHLQGPHWFLPFLKCRL